MEFEFIDPATDFSDGLEVLKLYHKDFLQKGQELLALIENIKQYGMSKSFAKQCVAAYCHHSMVNQLHHQDEEKFIFPLIVQNSLLIEETISRLRLEHQKIEQAWDILALELTEPEEISDFENLEALAIEFEKLQREHIEYEDKVLQPKLQRFLSSALRKEIGKKMFQSRQLDNAEN